MMSYLLDSLAEYKEFIDKDKWGSIAYKDLEIIDCMCFTKSEYKEGKYKENTDYTKVYLSITPMAVQSILDGEVVKEVENKKDIEGEYMYTIAIV